MKDARPRHHLVGVALLAFLFLLSAGCFGTDFVSIRGGTLVVTTLTTGSPVDPDGYELSVTGSGINVNQPIGTNEMVTFTVIGAGEVTITLRDAAVNCAVDENPHLVSTTLDTTTRADFNIVCL